MKSADPIVTLLQAILEGAIFATAIRRNGKPCRILLPNQLNARIELVRRHIQGAEAVLTFCSDQRRTWRERVSAVILSAYSPAVDGHCRWVGIDLDAPDHGQRGLVAPEHAARTIAERASIARLLDGLLVARSRRGKGRHIFLMLPHPTSLDDSVVGLASLVAAAFRAAAADVADGDGPHAFRQADGRIARPGQAGAIELIPHSTQKPKYGWAITLPAAGEFERNGGGVIVDPFTDKPIALETVPSCNPEAWACLVTESRTAIAKAPKPARQRIIHRRRDHLERIDARTRSFLDGHCSEGHRNRSAFAASANLLGCGLNEQQAWPLILAGAQACGLPEREARTAFSSAAKSVQRRKS